MKTLLHLNSSPRGNYSVSRKLSSEVVAAWKAKNPEGKVIERDLAKSHLTFVDLDWIIGAATPPENHSEAHKKALAVSDELVAELLASDVIVIGTPMYNFAVPAALKAWIDHIVRSGKAFSYKPNGVERVCGWTQAYRYCSQRRRLCRNLGFIGISDVTACMSPFRNSPVSPSRLIVRTLGLRQQPYFYYLRYTRPLPRGSDVKVDFTINELLVFPPEERLVLRGYAAMHQ